MANSRHRDQCYSVSSLDGQPILRRDAIAAPPARRAAKPAPKRIPLSAPVFARGDLGFFGLSGVLGGTAGGFDSEGAGGTEAVVDVEGLGVVEGVGEGVGVVVDGVGEGVGFGLVTFVTVAV